MSIETKVHFTCDGEGCGAAVALSQTDRFGRGVGLPDHWTTVPSAGEPVEPRVLCPTCNVKEWAQK